MSFDFANLTPVLPEIAILVLASTVLLVDLYLKDDQKGINHGLTLIGLGFLMLAYPLLAAILVTVPLWIVGGALVAGGLSLRRSLRDWRAEVRRMSRRWWTQD